MLAQSLELTFETRRGRGVKTHAVNLVMLDRICKLWKQRVQPTLGK
jgi:hypothetical protein